MGITIGGGNFRIGEVYADMIARQQAQQQQAALAQQQMAQEQAQFDARLRMDRQRQRDAQMQNQFQMRQSDLDRVTKNRLEMQAREDLLSGRSMQDRLARDKMAQDNTQFLREAELKGMGLSEDKRWHDAQQSYNQDALAQRGADTLLDASLKQQDIAGRDLHNATQAELENRKYQATLKSLEDRNTENANTRLQAAMQKTGFAEYAKEMANLTQAWNEAKRQGDSDLMMQIEGAMAAEKAKQEHRSLSASYFDNAGTELPENQPAAPAPTREGFLEIRQRMLEGGNNAGVASIDRQLAAMPQEAAVGGGGRYPWSQQLAEGAAEMKAQKEAERKAGQEAKAAKAREDMRSKAITEAAKFKNLAPDKFASYADSTAKRAGWDEETKQAVIGSHPVLSVTSQVADELAGMSKPERIRHLDTSIAEIAKSLQEKTAPKGTPWHAVLAQLRAMRAKEQGVKTHLDNYKTMDATGKFSDGTQYNSRSWAAPNMDTF